MNLLLVGAVVVAERQGHVYGMAMERRGLMTVDDKSLPDYWARTGWANTIAKLDIDFDVAFFGNSITRGSDFQACFPDKKIINLGYAGDNMKGMMRRVNMLQAANPHKIFIMAGTNDLVHINIDEYRHRYKVLLKAIMDSLPDSEIYIQSVLPSNHSMGDYAPNEKVQVANKIAEELASEMGCKFINLYDLYVGADNELPGEITRDGVHLYPQSYARWAEAIKPYVYADNE
ncbi:MAG: hypothetical protein K2M76_03060 [Muribaculaceae bacterium]|nr:hypothetical protein [Muribaculaceae bacterium]